MRQCPSASERQLWQLLNRRQLGVAFKRQAVVANCIVDFFAPTLRLVVEVDGGYHRDPARVRADARRDRKLAQAGCRVLRLEAEVVLHRPERALVLLRQALVP